MTVAHSRSGPAPVPATPDNSRVKRELGFQFRFTTEQALDAALAAQMPQAVAAAKA